MHIDLHAFLPWSYCKRVNGLQSFHLDILQCVRYLIQRRTVVSPDFLIRAVSLRRGVGSWYGVIVHPHLHGPSPEPLLDSGNVSLRFCYAGRKCEECPYNRLRSYHVDPDDRSDCFILESVHPDVGGVVHHGGYNSRRAVAAERPRSRRSSIAASRPLDAALAICSLYLSLLSIRTPSILTWSLGPTGCPLMVNQSTSEEGHITTLNSN